MEMGITFARETQALTEAQAQALLAQAWESFNVVASRQDLRVNEERPGRRFGSALQDLMVAKRVFYAQKGFDGPGEYPPNTTFGGWEDKEWFYVRKAVLEPVSDYLRRSGVPLTCRPEAIWSDLKAMGVLDVRKGRQYDNVLKIGGQVHVVLKIERKFLEPEDEDGGVDADNHDNRGDM